jgi:hypothetical protein
VAATKTASRKSDKSKKALPKTNSDSASHAARAKGGLTLDRRSSDRRAAGDRRQHQTPVAVERRNVERRAKVSRRRQIDPTTCERDYSCDEIEFMNAMDEYKRRSGRMFPTCSEVLEVIRGLGYQKQPPAEAPTVAGQDALATLGALPAPVHPALQASQA